MMFTALQRVAKAGFKSFWRNPFISLASVLVMTITLLAIGTGIFANALLDASLEQLEDKVDINVYLITSAEEGEIFTLKDALEQLPEVAIVAYTSREEALTNFRERHKNDQRTLQALDELEENPLRATLNVKAQETAQYETIATFLNQESELREDKTPIIDKIDFFQNQLVIERLTRIIDAAERLGFAATIIMIVISIIITLNTIRLAIYTAKEEISVMRLVGASGSYIQGPFVMEGMLYGFVAGILTLIIFYPLTFWLGPVTQNFFASINLFEYYMTNFGQIALIVVGSGAILGAVASFLAVKRYINV